MRRPGIHAVVLAAVSALLAASAGVRTRAALVPTVSSVSPAPGSASVHPGAYVFAHYSEPMAMPRFSPLVARGAISGTHTGSHYGGGSTLLLDPTADFFPGEEVAVSLRTSIQSLANGVAPTSPILWRFRAASGLGAGGFHSAGSVLGAAPGAQLSGRGIIPFDANGDGDVDLLDLPLGDPPVLWMNQGMGGFVATAPLPSAADVRDGVAADFDDDGDLDLALIAQNQNSLQRWLNDGSGLFTECGTSLAFPNIRCVAAGDMDGDGDADLVVSSDLGERLLVATGSAEFSEQFVQISSGHGTKIVIADVDGDYDMDVVSAGAGVAIRKRSTSGNFYTVQTIVPSRVFTDIAVGDLDGDGDLDIVACGPATANPSPTGVWLNSGTGSFTAFLSSLGGFSTPSLALGDLDGDGDLDLVTGSDGTGSARMWYSDGAAHFTDPGYLFAAGAAAGISLADVDGDHDLDLLVAGLGSAVSVHAFRTFDLDSSLLAGSAPLAAEVLSTQSYFQNVLQFVIHDAGSGDALPTVTDRIVIDLAGSTADASDGTWTLSCIALPLKIGTVSGPLGSQKLTFSGFGLSVPDGTSMPVTIAMSLPHAPASVRDNQFYRLALSAAGMSASVLGSQFSPALSQQIAHPAGVTYRVSATALVITKQPPPYVARGHGFDLEAAYTDVWGNVDADVTGDIVRATRQGTAGWLGASLPATGGIAKFTGANQMVLTGNPANNIVLYLADDYAGSTDISSYTQMTTLFTLMDGTADVVLGAGTLVPPAEISSVQYTAKPMLDFTLRDMGLPGSGGASFTAVEADLFGSTADAADFSWVMLGQGAFGIFGTVTGTPGSQKLTFTGLGVSLPMGGDAQSYRIFAAAKAKKLASADNALLKLSVRPTGFFCPAASSRVAFNQSPVTCGPGVSYRVAASRLTVVQEPASDQTLLDGFTASVAFTDEMGNLDSDVFGDIVVASRTDAGAVILGTSSQASFGLAKFSGAFKVQLGAPENTTGNLRLRFADLPAGSANLAEAPVESRPFTLGQFSRSDANLDGKITVGDLQYIVLLMFGIAHAEMLGQGDVTRDNQLTVADIQAVTNRILTGN